MKTSRKTIGVVVILSLVFFGLPAFCDDKAIGDADAMYTWGIDKEIAKCQAKIELLKNTRSANLQRDAVMARIKLGFLIDYKKEIIAAMKRKDIGTKDYYQISNFLNAKFFEVFAGGREAVGRCC